MGPSLLLLSADPAAGSDLILHLGLGWAQPFIYIEDPLELPRGVRGVYSVFSALPCPTSLLPSCKALSVCQPRGGCTSVLNETMLCQETVGFLKQIKLIGNCRPGCCICWW